MKKFQISILGVALFVSAFFSFCQSRISQAGEVLPQVTAFVGVNVLPMDQETTLHNHTVLVKGDRIQAVGPAAEVEIPEGALHIEAHGQYLMPGLAEMHGHIPSPEESSEFVESVLFLYLANGVTTVRGMLGWPGQLELKKRANQGDILSPTLYLAGPSFSGNSIDSPEQASARVREQKESGWDLLKVHPGLTRPEYDAMAQTASEVGIRFAGHVPAEVGLLHALEMGQETIDHLDGYIEFIGESGEIDPERMEQAITHTLKAGTGVVPTMALWETLLGIPDLETLQAYPELKYMPPQQVANWVDTHRKRLQSDTLDRSRSVRIGAARKRLLGEMNRRGIPIFLGTDAPQQFSVPGFSIHRELPIMVEVGMTPFQVIASGSRAVGQYFQEKDRFGTIRAGSRADLLLLEENPLTDVANISRRAGVMVRGRWIAEQEIQQRLKQIAASYR